MSVAGTSSQFAPGQVLIYSRQRKKGSVPTKEQTPGKPDLSLEANLQSKLQVTWIEGASRLAEGARVSAVVGSSARAR